MRGIGNFLLRMFALTLITINIIGASEGKIRFINFVCWIVIIFYICKFIYHRISRSININRLKDVQYFREIPDENLSPAAVAFLCNYENGTNKLNLLNTFSAVILSLALKESVLFEKTKDEKNCIRILGNGKNLTQVEKHVWNLLDRESNKENRILVLEEFWNKVIQNPEWFRNNMYGIEALAKEELEIKGYYRDIKRNTKKGKRDIESLFWITLLVVFLLFAKSQLGTAIIPISILYIATMLDRVRSAVGSLIPKGEMPGLKLKGVQELRKWKGLKKYLEDYSLLEEKGATDIILWEKYLMYATALGISDKVLDHFAIKNPEQYVITEFFRNIVTMSINL